MISKLGTLLIVEDTPSLARTYELNLRDEFDRIAVADTMTRALQLVGELEPTCILLDLKLPDGDGLDLLDRWVSEAIGVPVVVITANGSMTVAVDAMRRGAVDFVVKPTTKDRLRITLRNAVENFELKQVVAKYEELDNRTDFCGMIGSSQVMQAVFKSIEVAAPSKASVFVTGETGTGKELVARAVHNMSPRRKAKFVAINCGAIPKDLIESEIFGHVKGAFTGATSDRIGAAQLADGGTLFLDELGELPIDLQPKLLRFLQLGEFSRVGETRVQSTNIRIVAATNRDPLEAVRLGRLREDLYYRLHVIPISLPALRERGADILLLTERLLAKFAREEGKEFDGFSREAEEWLISYAWPGNVRELENLMRQLVVMNSGRQIERYQLPVSRIVSGSEAVPVPDEPGDPHGSISTEPDYGLEPMWLTEKKAIERAIALCRGNIVAAAKRLEINPSTIYRKRASWTQLAAGKS